MKVAKAGFRVEVKIPLLNSARSVVGWRFIEYTSRHKELDQEAANSFAEHLKRSKSAGRILSNADDSVVEEWELPVA